MKILLPCVFLIGACFGCYAQSTVLSVGSSKTLTIKTSTIFSADSLVFTPGSDFTISSNTVSVSPTPIPGNPTGSIKRVYTLTSPVTFTGNLQIFYKLSELNGNTESLLKWNDSTVGSWWISKTASTVNTGSHYVQFNVSSYTFNGATAAGSGVILPVDFIFFGATMETTDVLLQWTTGNSASSTLYEVEFSSDGGPWKTLTTVPGYDTPLPASFQATDGDLHFTSRLYRIKASEASGNIVYSKVIRIDNAGAANQLKIAARDHGAAFYFSGQAPAAVRIINISGQVCRSFENAASFYEVNALAPGVYIVQYIIQQNQFSRSFMVH